MPKWSQLNNKSFEAFEAYCNQSIVQDAIRLDEERGKTLTKDLLRDCFMAGAKFATDRCKAENHHD